MNALPDRIGLPHEPDCEASVLGGILIRPESLHDLTWLEVEHFWDMRNRVVFSAMRNLVADGRPIDVVLLEAELERTGKSEAVGGIAYLGELSLRVPTADNVVEYAALIKKAWRERKVLEELHEALARVKRGTYDADDVLDETVGELQRLQESSVKPVLDAGFGVPIIEFLGDEEPSSDPSEVFDVHGIIVTGEPALIIGPPKLGKTMAVEDLILHIAAGRSEWCGVPIYRRRRVLAFLREDSERTSRRRFWQLCRGAGIRHEELAGWLAIDVRSPLYFDDPKLVHKLATRCADFDICMVDSLSTIHNGDENSVERMAPVMNAWRDISLSTRTAIPLIHHFRKEGADAGRAPRTGSGSVLQRARGSSLIGATTRHAVGFDPGPDENQIVLSFESNHEMDTQPFVIARRFGLDRDDRKWIRHERVGTQKDAREASDRTVIDPVVLEVVRAAGTQGIGIRGIRDAVRLQLRDVPDGARGAGHARIDASVMRLTSTGRLERRVDRNYRVSGGGNTPHVL